LKICIDLDNVDLRLAEVCLDNLRKIMNLPTLEMEQFVTFCVKRMLYNEDKVDPKGTGH
jgi:hypothetical protein